MTIKVVTGVVRGSEPLASAGQNIQSQASAALRNSAVSVAGQSVISDATVVSLRCSRAHASAERISSEGEAKSLAKDVAERIEREGDASLEAHGGLDGARSVGSLAD